MNYTVYLQTEAQPAALERLLRVVRHRQFELRSLYMETSADRRRLTVRVSVKSERPIDQLRNQLMKLNDVLWVKPAQELSHDILSWEGR